MAGYILYGAPHSYFTAKARCYLLCKGISFDEVLASLRVYKKIIKPRTGLRFIPVIITPEDETLQDTTVFIHQLEARHPDPKIIPQTPVRSLAALILELFADDWMLPHAMHYRWDFPADNARYLRDMFGKTIMPRMPKPIRHWAAKKVVKRFAGFAPALGVTPETAPALEAQMGDMLSWLEAHFEHHPYLLGARPTLADVAFCGPFHGHMAIDPYPKRMLTDNYPRIMGWVARMRQATTTTTATAMESDCVPDTVLPFLQLAFAAQVPNLLLTEEKLMVWRDEHPGQRVPRSVGRGAYYIGSTVAHKLLQPYNLWRWQRILDHYQSLNDTEKTAVQPLLDAVGGTVAMQRAPRLRLTKDGTRLVMASSVT